MSVSKQAKDAGLKSLQEVSELSNVPIRTLHNWSNHKPQLFKVVLAGCVYLKYSEKLQ